MKERLEIEKSTIPEKIKTKILFYIKSQGSGIIKTRKKWHKN